MLVRETANTVLISYKEHHRNANLYHKEIYTVSKFDKVVCGIHDSSWAFRGLRCDKLEAQIFVKDMDAKQCYLIPNISYTLITQT